MQGTKVWFQVQEDSTYWRVIKSVCHHYWAHKPQLPLCPRGHALQQEKPLQWEAHALQLQSSPSLPQQEKIPRTAMKTQHSQK